MGYVTSCTSHRAGELLAKKTKKTLKRTEIIDLSVGKYIPSTRACAAS